MKVKRFLLLLVLLLFAIMLSGCVQKTIDSKGIERHVSYGLIEIETLNGNGAEPSDTVVAYDPQTMICYLKISGYYRLGISPYYIIGEDGKPEIAVYGVNYP